MTASLVEAKLAQLGLTLPSPPLPMANYVPAVRTGSLVFVSGHGPRTGDGFAHSGKLGADIDVARGAQAARLAMLNCLASLKAEIGDLDRVTRVVKVLGMVNSAPDFTSQGLVVNGASDLLTTIFGTRGKHARSAVGMMSLPAGISVEIEMVVEVGEAVS